MDSIEFEGRGRIVSITARSTEYVATYVSYGSIGKPRKRSFWTSERAIEFMEGRREALLIKRAENGGRVAPKGRVVCDDEFDSILDGSFYVEKVLTESTRIA